jgi:hypothetical protein
MADGGVPQRRLRCDTALLDHGAGGIAAVWNGGAWRGVVAEFADEPVDLADRLTGEGAGEV